MNKKLLFFFMTVLVSTVTLNAQTKVWDFGNDVTTWPVHGGYGPAAELKDNLAIIPLSTTTNMAQIENAHSSGYTFSDSYVVYNRFKFNGDSGITLGKPTKRYFYIDVNGSCDLKIWARTGGSGTRNLFVSDGTTVLGTLGSGTSGAELIFTSSYSGGPGRLYVYCDSSINLYKMELSPLSAMGTTTLGVKQFEKTTAVNVFAHTDKVFIKNVQAKTKVDIYSMTGSLVKNVETSVDTDFLLKPGAYLVKIKAADGQKVVKLVTQ